MNNKISDDELRKEIMKDPFNGKYAIRICRKCKSFLADPDGRTMTAKIVDVCKNCFEEDGK